ncbi:MAG: acetolactate synthase [Frankiaceae bacterium]
MVWYSSADSPGRNLGGTEPFVPATTPPHRHGGHLAVEVLRGHGVATMYTLSGGHVFPLYDAAARGEPPLPIVDVRHEQSAVFAAEAEAKLRRTCGLAVLTAGPGVTNGVSGVATAHFNGSPLVVLGGRAPQFRWGTGSLQELDHPPILAPVTKRAASVTAVDQIGPQVGQAARLAATAHRGPVFLDLALDAVFGAAMPTELPGTESASPLATAQPAAGPAAVREPNPDDLAAVGALLSAARRPVLVLGTDVWADRADAAARRFAEELRVPVVANGMGRGVVPAADPLSVSRVRSAALGEADLVLVAGAPLDFRLSFGAFGGRGGRPPARVVHLADSADSVATHVDLAATASGDLTRVLDGVAAHVHRRGAPDTFAWLDRLRGLDEQAIRALDAERATPGDPVHPARVYGALADVLDDDAVVVCDGGDFVSFAGRLIDSQRPGCWLDPGPFGCLGTGLGYAIAARRNRPDAQVAVLLGDGAAGFSLMDADTLVRHRLPVVLVVGNNGIWGLEKHPMRAIYGYDVAADLQPGCRYDKVVSALGGAGEFVERADDVRPALARAFELARQTSGPVCVNVALDPSVAYPRSSVLA